MKCRHCGKTMVDGYAVIDGVECVTCVERLFRMRPIIIDLGANFGAHEMVADAQYYAAGHPLNGGGTFSNVPGGHEADYSTSRTAWYLYDQGPLRPRRRATVFGANGKPVIDVDAQELDANSKTLTRTR